MSNAAVVPINQHVHVAADTPTPALVGIIQAEHAAAQPKDAEAILPMQDALYKVEDDLGHLLRGRRR